ncbi:MAG: cobaltochelatase subunit CobN [Rhodobacterales bacterium]|nr:MAG: cobaltochelatase subunit CobN [Rhodobacterales bacterium]
MHLLAATPGAIDDGKEPVDLAQSPADILFISAADTELAALSQARADMDAAPSLRLANLTHLAHPLSVDLHIETCASKCKLGVARVLGGQGYWRYGVEQYAAHCQALGIPLALLPGDDKPDPDLALLSTVSEEDYAALWAYMVEGGPENTTRFLTYAQAMLTGSDKPAPAAPLLKSGLYWPGKGLADFDVISESWQENAPVVAVVFYRALVQSAGLEPIGGLVSELAKLGLNPLPIFVSSLKDPLSAATLQSLFETAPPSVILNCTSFAVGSPHEGDDSPQNPLTMKAANAAPVFQVVLSTSAEATWHEGTSGLSARDIAMNVALPEVDGRVLTRAISFKGEAFFDAATECPIATYRARPDRIAFVAQLAKNWAELRHTPLPERRVALILANYPNKDGRLANGVGLDTPAATIEVLNALVNQGYRIRNTPESAQALMQTILSGPTNWLTDRAQRSGGTTLPLGEYLTHFHRLPQQVQDQIAERWGTPESDPFFEDNAFRLSLFSYGNAVVGVQPARGYNIDPTDTYHCPDLVPPHNYLAFPHIYPFIVNDPGEGTQAKRRASAVIIDHLTPPLTRAESYGPMKDLEALVDEYYEAAGVDPRRIEILKKEILSLTTVTGLDEDAGLTGDEENDLAKLDAYLCELKEAQIRDGLHVFGKSPEGRLSRDLVQALVRIPRGDGKGENASLIRALALDLELNFDPLDCDFSAPWTGPKPAQLSGETAWRSHGDTVERLEEYAARLIEGEAAPGPASSAVLNQVEHVVKPKVTQCGPAELDGILTAFAGKFVPPGPSGAPTRGRLDTLPTGRNFYSVDSRAVPTPTAWSLGWKSANLLIDKHLQTHGDWPRAMLITAWGTANMRTGGDDIAQALALMGVKPQWDKANRRVTGFEIIPETALGRPRVDVTLRISGFFRDAFPSLISLFDSAARAVMELDEPDSANPAAARAKTEGIRPRVYGSKPGAYGAGLQALIDERLWNDRADFAEAYLEWGGYSYGAGNEGKRDRAGFEQRLSQTEAIVQNQDNREHDILDSDDYYQFEGGAAAAVAHLQGQDRPIYHNDHSRPERPVIRTLDDEIGRVVRSRVVNPKWIEGVKRHGYKGAFEIAATVDYLFAFAATTHAVKNHHFDLVHAAFLEDEETRDFIEEHNPAALAEIAQRLEEAIEKGLWIPRSNSARALLEQLRQR